jgi:hypothetical protein
MSKDKTVRVEFAPGCFDGFEGTQEELDAMVAEIERMALSGELEELAVELGDDEWDLLPEEDKLRILQAQDDQETPNTRH